MNCLAVFLVLCLWSGPAFANHLLLKAQRAQWEEKGWSFDIAETADYISVYKGGLVRKGTFNGLFEAALTLDTKKMGLWPGGTLFMHGTNTQGHLKATGEMVGDTQAVNNNEAPRATRLYEIWYEQALIEKKLSLLAGIHDINTEFMVSDNAGLYINGAFGVTTTMSVNVPTSAYPLAAPAVRVKFAPDERWEFLAGVYDGDPGSSAVNTHSTHWAVKRQDGLMAIGQAGYKYDLPPAAGLPGVVRAGAWHHSKDFNDVGAVDGNGDPVRHDDNYGGYVYWDQKLYKEKDEQGLSVFFIGAGTPENRNTIVRHFAGGLNYAGLVPGRDSDQAGVAFTQSCFGDKTRAVSGQEAAETTIEGTYRIEVNDYLAIQPDFQYVVNPGGNAAVKNASVLTLRTEITF